MTTTPQPSRVALVTGASRGLGRSAALHLARAGVGVIGTYASAADAARSLQTEIEDAGGTAAVLRLDTGRSDTFPAFATELRDVLSTRFGRETFDHLVNNAGIGLHVPYAETTEAQYDELFAVNVKGPFFLTQVLAPLIADGGRVLNVSSGLARLTRAGASAYAATKGVIEVLTRYQARRARRPRGARQRAGPRRRRHRFQRRCRPRHPGTAGGAPADHRPRPDRGGGRHRRRRTADPGRGFRVGQRHPHRALRWAEHLTHRGGRVMLRCPLSSARNVHEPWLA